MKLALLTATIATLSTLTAKEPPKAPQSHAADRIQVALMCFKTGEQVSGINRICYYNCAGSQAAITVSASALCPLSINQ